MFNKSLPSNLTFENTISDNLMQPINIFLDKADYVVKLNLYSYATGDGQNHSKPSFALETSSQYTMYNLHPSGNEFVYGTFLYKKDLPKANSYTGKIYVYDKNNLNDSVLETLVTILIKEDIWSKNSTVATVDGYMTKSQLLEAVYSINHRTLLPIDIKDCKNGVLTYKILDGKKKYIAVSNSQTGSYLPAGATYKVYNASTNQPVKLANYQDKIPVNDYLDFYQTNSEGEIQGLENSEVISSAKGKSVAIIYGIPSGKYFLKAFVANKEITDPVYFTF
jgi:hypothetical protein